MFLQSALTGPRVYIGKESVTRSVAVSIPGRVERILRGVALPLGRINVNTKWDSLNSSMRLWTRNAQMEIQIGLSPCISGNVKAFLPFLRLDRNVQNDKRSIRLKVDGFFSWFAGSTIPLKNPSRTSVSA